MGNNFDWEIADQIKKVNILCIAKSKMSIVEFLKKYSELIFSHIIW